MKLEPAILSVIGWHAKESVEEIVERKCNDIKRIGQTFWFFRSWKAPIPYVAAIVEDKRLGPILAYIAEQQKQLDMSRAAKAPRRSG